MTTLRSRMMLLLAATGLAAAACGGSSSGGSAAPAQVAASSTPASGNSAAGASSVTVTTHAGPLGTYLTDGSGRSLYVFAADTGSTSMCDAACAKYWPPLIASAVKAAGKAEGGSTGTSMRADGSTQVTFAGHPLYYYVGDKSAGATNGQGLDVNGGKWWLVAPDGKPITGSAPASSSSSSGGWG